MEIGSSSLLSSSAMVSDEPEPEPEQQAPAGLNTDDYFGTGPDGRPVFIGTGGLDGTKAKELDDLTRIGAGTGGTRPYRVLRRAAVSAGLDLASSEKGHLEVGEIVQVAEIVVYAGRARVRFQPSAEGRPGGWASVRSGGGRELLQPLNQNSSQSDTAGRGLWATPRERATQLLCGVHGLSDVLSAAMLERPVAADGATELTDDEWCEALCAMGGAEVRDLASLAQQKLDSSAAIDVELEQGSSALLAGDYAVAKQHFGSALASCESPTLERGAVERARAASNGFEQAEKGLKFAAMSEDDLLRAHARMIDDESAGQQLGISSGGAAARLSNVAPTLRRQTLVAPATTASAGGPQGRSKAPLPPYAGPSRPSSTMFSIYWRMPKGEPAPMTFDVECVALLSISCYWLLWGRISSSLLIHYLHDHDQRLAYIHAGTIIEESVAVRP
jgi:hypothetical protein